MGAEALKGQIHDIGKTFIEAFAVGELMAKTNEFVKKGVEEFQKEAEVTAKLTQSLGFQSTALDELAKAQSRVTLFTKNQIKINK